MDHHIDEHSESASTSPPRSKPKRMSSIKKIGKLLGISSKKKTKADPVQEDQQEEDEPAYNLPVAISTMSPPKPEDTTKSKYVFPSPIAHILAPKESESDKPETGERAKYSFSKPKSFYRASDASRKSSSNPIFEDCIAEETSHVPIDSQTDSLLHIISTDVDDAPPRPSMDKNNFFMEEDFAGDIATKSLRSALSQTQVFDMLGGSAASLHALLTYFMTPTLR